MNYVRLHDLTLDALYGALLLVVFVALERGFYLTHLGLAARRLAAAIRTAEPPPLLALVSIDRPDVLSASLAEYIAAQDRIGITRTQIEDLSAALYLTVDGKTQAGLWLLDLIVTAAPLIGLLGTILGIMETFGALSQGQVSDPGAVSRGIGGALTATALGIGTALCGLGAHAVLYRQARRLSDAFKGFLLRTTR